MAKLVPPQLVRGLMTRGCSGELDTGANAFNPEESVALVRWLARLLGLRTAEAGDAMVETLAAVFDASAHRHRIPEPLACHKGCGSCCHQQVSVPAPEIFAVARRVTRSKAAAEHRARLAARPDRRGGPPERVLDAAKPCVFLTDGACRIHPFRPMVCRAIVSLSKPACLARFAAGNGAFPYPRPYDALRAWSVTILWTAHAAAGIAPRSFDFESGVAAVLDDPSIEARWYAGEAVMLDAIDPPLPPSVAGDIARLRELARL